MAAWNIGAIECFSSQPEQIKKIWSIESFKLIFESRVHLAHVQSLLAKPSLMRLTRDRLKHLEKALIFQIACYEDLLRPLGWALIDQHQVASLLSMAPGSSFLADNIINVFRDWSWGAEENKISLQLVKSIWPELKIKQDSDLLVIGSGASRLACDLMEDLKLTQVIALDRNPFFHLVLERLLQGQTIDMYEFPIVPTLSSDFACLRNLSYPYKSPEAKKKPRLILADILDLEIEWPSASTILTPWLVDVLDADFVFTSRLINHNLKIGAHWVNFGPLGFNNPQLDSYYSYEEVKYIIEKSGFKILKEFRQRIPYLHNPSSNSHRQEMVYGFLAEKVQDVELGEFIAKTRIDWLEDKELPIQIPVKVLRLEEAHLFNSKIAHILNKNAGLSFNKLMEELGLEVHVPKEHLESVVEQILVNFYGQSLQNPLDHR